MPCTWSVRASSSALSSCGGALAAQHRLDVGRALPHQLQHQLAQELDDLVGVVCRARRHRVGRLGQLGRGDERLQHHLAHTTRSRSGLPLKKSWRFSNARMPIATRVSVVALPRCGSRTTLSMVVSACVTCGSRSNTSRPAPAIRLDCERLDQRGLVHHVAAGGVDQEGVGPHPARSRSRFIRCRVSGVAGTVQRDEVRLAQHVLERSHAARRRARSATSAGGGNGS